MVQTRSVAEPVGQKENEKPQHHETRRVLLVPECLREKSTDPQVFCLKHPRTGSEGMYVSAEGSSKLYEVVKQKEKFRSWFFGSMVVSDGSLTMFSPVDPLFLALPLLVSQTQKRRYVPGDQVFCDTQYPDSLKLIEWCPPAQLALVADSKDCGDITAYRFNQDKTFEWLKKKVTAVEAWLGARGMERETCGDGAASSFVRSKKAAPAADEGAVRRYAWGIVSDYLTDKMSEELKSFLDIRDPPKPVKSDEPPAKKSKVSEVGAPTEDYSSKFKSDAKENKNKKLTTAQKKLAKVDKTGMKTMASFFAPKNK